MTYDELSAKVASALGSEQAGLPPSKSCELLFTIGKLFTDYRKSLAAPSATNVRELAERIWKLFSDAYQAQYTDCFPVPYSVVDRVAALLESSSLQPKWERLEACPECDGDGCNNCASSSLQAPKEKSNAQSYRVATDLIGLFLEYRDVHGKTEESAKHFAAMEYLDSLVNIETSSVPQQVTAEMVARLAHFIYQKESLNCKTLDEAVHHQSNWRRAIPEAREMLEVALAESLVTTPPSLAMGRCDGGNFAGYNFHADLHNRDSCCINWQPEAPKEKP